MAGAVNRIVPSSIASERASWQEKAPRRKRERETRAGRMPPDEQAVADAIGGTEPALKEPITQKGKHLDVSV
jgi:hypothetical protein